MSKTLEETIEANNAAILEHQKTMQEVILRMSPLNQHHPAATAPLGERTINNMGLDPVFKELINQAGERGDWLAQIFFLFAQQIVLLRQIIALATPPPPPQPPQAAVPETPSPTG